ncbi:MAG: type II toxin-antitoxin system YafQ family toxin [Pseudomonadota bacterium]
MLKPKVLRQFKRDVKLMAKRGKNQNKLSYIMLNLIEEKSLAKSHKDHVLTGNYKGYRECHIEPDWLLIYKVIKKEKIIVFVKIGTHSDLFR